MSQTIIELLKSVEAVLTNDHFVLTTGKHSDTYINKDALYPHTEKASQVGKMFAEQCQDLDIDVVVAPALGGIILSQWTAHHLSQLKQKEVLGVYAEKGPDKTFVFTRGYDKLIADKNILVLEDLTTTGGSVKKVVDAVRQVGGKVVMVGVMVNRNPEQVNETSMTAPFFSLGTLEVKAYDENELPKELAERPINTQVGHGKKYLDAKKV